MYSGERQAASPELYNSIEKGLWLSKPDIAVAEDRDILFLPSEERDVTIQLTPDSLPPIEQVSLEFYRHLRVTERSRFAQVFFGIESQAGEDVYNHLIENGINTVRDLDPELLRPKIRVVNRAMRANILQKDARFFRFYYPGGKHLVGEELEQAPILVDSKPVEDHVWRRNAAGEPVALRLSLNPDTRMWIPPGTKPIKIDPNILHPRAQIQNWSTKAPETSEVIPYVVFSNERLTMPDGMYGLVRSYAYSNSNGKETQASMSVHGTSQLLDDGRDWNIIFELRGRTSPESVARYVDIDLFATRNIIQQ